MADVIMALGSEELEEALEEVIGSGRIENVEGIDLIQEILMYDSFDFVIVNTLLSKRKTVMLADFLDNGLDGRRPQLIALVKDLEDKKFIAQLVGFGVHAFVPFQQISLAEKYMEKYPDNFDLGLLAEERSRAELVAARPVNGTVSIGVFNLDSGAGATTCSLKLAEEIANCGYRVICIEIDHKNFSKLKKVKNVEWISADMKEKDAILQMAFSDNSFQFIVIDFGKIFEVDLAGELLAVDQQLLGDLMRCNYKVGMCFASPWHNQKLEVFLKTMFQKDIFYHDQLFLVTSGADPYEDQLITDYHELPIWSRSQLPAFSEQLMQRLRIGTWGKRKEKRIQLFRRKAK